jgi:alkyl hydroperoxide reductase subunit AhpC
VDAIARVGSLAPEFDLPCTPLPGSGRRRAALGDFRDRWLGLVFYPRDFSLVCPTELIGLGARIEEFRRRRCELLGISCDAIETHEQWLATPRSKGGLEGLGFALASDEDGAVSRAYGVLLEPQHVALRGLFLIDPDGVLQYQVVHNLSVGRRTDHVLRILAALQAGGLCAGNWEVDDPTLDPTHVLGPGSLISHYRIEAPVGSGTFATVFRARDLMLQRTVALKVLKPGAPIPPTTVLAEARSAAALSHPNVCTVFGVDDSEGVPIIAMEFLQGRPLGRLLEREGRLALDRAADVARQVASGMAVAHARGIVHGDLKPENVMVTEDGVAKILDFGLARRDMRTRDPDETDVYGLAEADAGVFGTPSYMAPEQTRGEPATAPSDVFALGSLLYEMHTGRKAFPGDNVLHVLDRIRSVDPDRLAADLPDPFADIARRAFVADRAGRTITMDEIAERLARPGVASA